MNNTKLIAAMVLSVLAGCSERAVVVSTRDDGLRVSTRSCTHTAYCATMMPGLDGKMEYRFKLSPYCPGKVRGIARVYTDTLQYPSKPNETFVRQREEWRRDTGGGVHDPARLGA